MFQFIFKKVCNEHHQYKVEKHLISHPSVALDKTRIVNSKINHMSHLIVFSLHGILSEVHKKLGLNLPAKEHLLKQ